MEASCHEFEEHTSEVKMRVQAATLPALFAEAGRGLAELMAEKAAEPSQIRADEPVVVGARDVDALLAEWLNELVYRTERRGRIYTAMEIDRLTDTALEGRIGGEDVSEFKTPVKAATLHDLHIAPQVEGEGWTASVVLDV